MAAAVPRRSCVQRAAPGSLRAAAAALGNGSLTSVALCEHLLARHREVDDAVHGFLELDATRVLAAARASDARRAAGRPLSPWDGLPIALKDNLAVTGERCTCASRLLAGYTAPYDATVVARLKAAGLVPFGRTNLDEFAMGSSTENSAYGATHNPWDLGRVPGGSSGGSAAVVASGQALAALGSDTGGSIRQPAGFCGLVGLKPTYGRVSRYGLVAFASSLDQIGPITVEVRDAALLYDLIAGHDPRDCTSLNTPAGDLLAGLAAPDVRGLRVGVAREHLDVAGLDPAVRAATERSLKLLEDAGAVIVPVSLPHTEYVVATYYVIATAEASSNLARFDGVRYGARVATDDLLGLYFQTRRDGFGAEVKRRIILGTYVLSSGYYDAYYRRAQQVRTLLRRDFATAFAQADVLLCPVAPTPAFAHGALADPLQMYLADVYTIPVNLAGNCAVSLPVGRSASGLPLGVQFIADALQEPRLLRAAAWLEGAAGFVWD